ncbi:transcriptional regulator [Longimonas halophila]|uniref:Transcriptional regulator n=1 Tax=Longimonas halophila TaxID=1469170 RepID=A0A2H3NQU2_9BACT|nr:ATP-binding protein [Longimonas halophila]PEN09442.1 transcriptional regulator [Longimonas halophila]
MTLQELKQLVSLGEGRTLEFKHRVPRAERIAKEVIALANTDGGRILLGVDDDGTLVGVDDAAEEAFMLRRAISQLCDPPVSYHTDRVVIAPRRDVLVVHVPESPGKPHVLRDAVESEGLAYIRVDDMSVEASPESVRLMEERPATNGMSVSFGESESLLLSYLNDYGRVTVAEFARMADLPEDEASAILVQLTRADLLMLHANRDEDFFTLSY